MKDCSVVDIFCGIGGLTHGFVKEDFNVVAGFDIDGSCRYAYEHSNDAKFICKSIEEVQARDILGLYPNNHIRILVGCAPCQPFSLYKKRYGSIDEKWKLLGKFANLIASVQPDIVSMENVPELLKFNKGKVFANFVKRLSDEGYIVTHHVVYCPDYGIPQKRTRLVVFASKLGAINLIDKTFTQENYRTVRDTIGSLPMIKAGESSSSDSLHRAAGMSNLNQARIRQSLPGGSWQDWDDVLKVACHKKESGSHYRSVYGRMSWDEPAPTLTTECYAYGSGRFGHPEQDRAISLREAALLQTFPVDYTFGDPQDTVYFKVVGRHIGNAVPVDLGCVIAKSIAKHLEVNNDPYQQQPVQDVYQLECTESFRDRSI